MDECKPLPGLVLAPDTPRPLPVDGAITAFTTGLPDYTRHVIGCRLAQGAARV